MYRIFMKRESMKNTIKLFDFDLTTWSFDDVITYLLTLSKRKMVTRVLTLNAQFVSMSKNNILLKKLMKESNLIVADGKSILCASKLVLNEKIHQISGLYLVKALLKKSNVSFYFFGASFDVIDKAVKRCSQQYPNSSIVGFHHGYVDGFQLQAIARDIKEKKPDFILVGMGFPKQEYIIKTCTEYCDKGVFIGVGGVFDVLSGQKKECPKWIANCGLEWFYRAWQHPKKFLTYSFIIHYLLILFREVLKR